MRDVGDHFGWFTASFSIYFGFLGGFWLPSASWEVFWAAPGWVLVASWGRLGAQDRPSNPKFSPKPNPLGVLGRLEGSFLGASQERFVGVLVRFEAASSIANEKR